MLYNFESENAEQFFEEEINNRFRRHKTEENGVFKYFGFADREEPGVVDKLNEILTQIGIGTKDFVALYHSGNGDHDDIKQQMLIGHDDLVETKVKNVTFDNHRNNLTSLLNFDYVKA